MRYNDNLSLRGLLFIVSLMIISGEINSQDLAKIMEIKNITKKKPFEFGGRVAIGAGYFNSNASVKRTAPYNWFVSGSPYVTIYGINISITFTYSETGRSLSHPYHYNFTGASPYYKWATMHVGFRNLNFSEYTVSGVMFNGVGLELNLGKFRFGAFYGVFNPAVEVDSTDGNFGVITTKDGLKSIPTKWVKPKAI